MFDKIGISVQGNFVRRQEGVLLRKSGRKLKSLFYLTIIVVLCIFLVGCNKKGEITFEQAADEVFSEEISNQSEVGESKETDVETDAWIYVDVAGAVRTPGVVKLARGARVYEAIELAGGFAKDAAISAVNQASVLQDVQQLYIVTVEEQKTKQLSSSEVSLETSGEGRVADAGKVNINQASEEEVMTLPGIGASKAADIVRYREEQGRFEQIEDIMNISGIKEAVFGKIKDKITVQQ